MIKLKELSALVTLCKNYGYTDLARNFNSIRSVSLVHQYRDFTFECKQILDTLDTKKYPKVFLNEISSIIYSYAKGVDYTKIVRACNAKNNNSETLAKALYNEWVTLGKEEKHLIGIYREMVTMTLSTYELEVLTSKRLVMDKDGKDTIAVCSHEVNIDLLLESNSDESSELINVMHIFDKYKNKYNISDKLWDSEFNRLAALCNTKDEKTVAAFIVDHLL